MALTLLKHPLRRLDADLDENQSHEARGVDGAASTYFEYDPYPVRAQGFAVYRLADAAPDLGAPAGAKALYRFDIRPSGTRVQIAALQEVQGRRRVLTYTIPGRFEFLTTAPMVVRAGAGEDWFVWLQRYGLDLTGGRLVAIAPGRASSADWQSGVGNLLHDGVRCDVPSSAGDPRTVAVVYIGARSNCDEANLSEIHPSPGMPAGAGSLRFVALKTHSCISGSNILCIVSVNIDVAGGASHQCQEPSRAIDQFNAPRTGSTTRREIQRYRNFASAPFALLGPGDPVVAWLRRGTDQSGKDYHHAAVVRRMATVRGDEKCHGKDRAQSLGPVRLEEFTEDHEPVFVVGRASNQPRLVSMRPAPPENGSPGLIVQHWVLPQTASGEAPADHLERPSAAALCGPGLDGTWLSRPPSIVVRDGGDAIVVLSRVERVSPAEESAAFKLQIATLHISAEGVCSTSGAAIEVARLESLTSSEPPRHLRAKDLPERLWRLQEMRRQPLLVDDVDGDGRLDLVVPHSGELELSHVRLGLLDAP